ncbi:hypothetical protein DFH27DRAFT_481561 [Peziza echinospora]|nr:hypothetical protein DFH27DRAFT_481561 [Peziza echinospora]
MWKGIALAILFTIIPGANAGDDGDDFSNNLFSDLAPVLSLFGEQVAKQFMSQSMYWEDDIIFAMAPLGVLTAIVGAIRVGGPTWMKALIGRARENRAAAEVELMSSTSTDVCELWNGQTIVRMMGAPTILELIYFPERTHEADCGIYTLEEARKKKLVQLSKKEHAQPTRKRNKQLASAAPNIFLNLRPRKSRLEARLFAALGIAIQVAVFIFAAETTYDLNYKKAGRAVPQYAFPLMTAGTVILELGMFLCSYVVEWYTKEGVWEFGENENASLLWLQKGANVNDQVFGSYAIFAKGKRDSILTSRLYANHSGHSNFLQSLVVTATIVSLFGFVIQFIGLRGMNWSTTVAQLVATMAMVVVRAWIRRGLALRPTVRNTPPGHELDWLASRMAGAPDDGLGKDDEEKSADDDDERQFQSETCWSWIIVTGGDISSCHFREVEMDLSLDQIEVQDTDIESSAGEDTEDKDDSNDDRSTTSDNELRIR